MGDLQSVCDRPLEAMQSLDQPRDRAAGEPNGPLAPSLVEQTRVAGRPVDSGWHILGRELRREAALGTRRLRKTSLNPIQ